MKKILFCALLLSKLSFARIIEESLIVTSNDKSEIQTFLNKVKKQPEVIIDHLKENSFEVYGPQGLSLFLKQNNIHFEQMTLPKDDVTLKYPTPEEIEKELKGISEYYSDLTELYSIGKSVEGRNLWVIKICKKNGKPYMLDTRPEFKYIANMHGDEIVGRELMMNLIKDLLLNYGRDQRITDLIDNTQIHILVSMNPDGARKSRRANAKNIDLNRDFPDFSTSDNQNTLEGRAPETQSVMKWQNAHHFKLSANFHGGAEVVNYPWDTISNPFPREEYIKNLSLEYANKAPYISASTSFKNGITNGYAWYEVNGGMQDWSIHYHQDMHITVELSDSKWPDYSKIDYYYKQNREALISFIEKVHAPIP